MKEVLVFNERAFNAKRSELTNRVSQKNEALGVVKKITEDKVKELDFDKVCAYLNNKSGFANSEMSAKAFNLTQEYDFIKSMSNSQHKDEELITLKDGKYSFNEDELKDVYTTYIDEAYMKTYKELLKASKVLNSLPAPLRRLFNVNADMVTIDKVQFNTLMQMTERGI